MANDYFSAGIASADANKMATEMNTLSNMAYHMAAQQKLADAFLQMQGGNRTAAELARQMAMINPEYLFKTAGSPHVMGGSMAVFNPLRGQTEIQATSQNIKEGEKAVLGGNVNPLLMYQMGNTDPLKPTEIQGAPSLPSKVKEYEYAKKQGFEGSLQEWIFRTKESPNIHVGGGNSDSKFLRDMGYAEKLVEGKVKARFASRTGKDPTTGKPILLGADGKTKITPQQWELEMQLEIVKERDKLLRRSGYGKLLDAYSNETPEPVAPAKPGKRITVTEKDLKGY
jgi:hypothetical protein